jgi:preprotein translocase subunit YajC
MNAILLQAAQGGSSWTTLIMMGLVFVVFYFFMIRPQQKKAKDAEKFRDSLKVGDKVITLGGLHGTIVSADNETIVLNVDNGVRLTFEKSAISAEATARKSKGDSK